MTPNPKPKNIEDLLANAKHYAEYCMRGTGNLPPTLFLIAADGKQLMFMPESLADVRAKDDFATMSKLVAIASGATAAVMALEAWVKTAKPGEDFDRTELPSEAFDRQECVVLMAESMTEGHRHQMFPIIRSGNHKFFGFGDNTGEGLTSLQGRFSQLLPTQVPDKKMRAVAATILKAKRARFAKS